MLKKWTITGISAPFRKLAEAYDDYYYSRKPSFFDTFADHPTLVAGGGATLAGLGGYGVHSLGTWAMRHPHEKAIANHYRAIGEVYDKTRSARKVERFIKDNNIRQGIDAARKKSAKVLASANKLKIPAVALSGILGGALAYNHFFG